ncbi:hypothetical protein CBR_g30052 [Chara braunii]|uniref:Uncharacterized protein n=1 Tax=Chara braunii TaxID=69332 RepID=A0A388LBU6_CHABU|nr:hypothetical protein CBR_g30052 [Chara braunii]|eukprot:GBG79790.1 hypothetical protein CBR_g30052 [Chara braunii]
MEAAAMQDAIAATMLADEGAALEIVRMHKQQMEELHIALIQHRGNLPADLLEEGEELVSGWDEMLHADLSSHRLGETEKAQVMAELGACAEVLMKVRRIFDELRDELYGSSRRDKVKGSCCVGPEEGQVLRTMLLEDPGEAKGVLCRGRPEEGQGSPGEPEERDNGASTTGSHANTNVSTVSKDIAADFMNNTVCSNNKNNNNNNTDRRNDIEHDDNVCMDKYDDKRDCRGIVLTGAGIYKENNDDIVHSGDGVNHISCDDENSDINTNNSMVVPPRVCILISQGARDGVKSAGRATALRKLNMMWAFQCECNITEGSPWDPGGVGGEGWRHCCWGYLTPPCMPCESANEGARVGVDRKAKGWSSIMGPRCWLGSV